MILARETLENIVRGIGNKLGPVEGMRMNIDHTRSMVDVSRLPRNWPN
jgi:hypothetical protein